MSSQVTTKRTPVENKWSMEALQTGGLTFLNSHKEYCDILAKKVCNQLNALTFLVPFDGTEIKAQIKDIRKQVADCYYSADRCKRVKIGSPDEYSKIDKVAKQAYKQMDFLDYLTDTVTFMERKNVVVSLSVSYGLVAICCSLFARYAVKPSLEKDFNDIAVVSTMMSLFSIIGSVFYNSECLQKNYDVRAKSINIQLSELKSLS